MDEISTFTDSRHEGHCIHCRRGFHNVEATRDHVPTKTLLRKPYPANLPLAKVCKDCNKGFSDDEQYLVAFLSATMCGSADPEAQGSEAAKGILGYRKDIRAAVEAARREYMTVGRETRLLWEPDMRRVERVVVKNARGHAMFEMGEPMLDDPASVTVVPLAYMTPTQRQEFEEVAPFTLAAWPEVGGRMMTRLMTGQDLEGQWIVVQEGVYRYSVDQEGGMLVRSVMGEYLATEVLWH